MKTTEVFSSIQVLRGVAAVMVVIYHLPFYVGFADTVPVLRAGVDLFFVISGFVMMVSTLNKRDDVSGFVRNRLVRIVPLYWLATLAFALLWVLAGIRELRLDELVMSLLLVPYLDQSTTLMQPILGVGWTLNLELGFYVLFALTMLLRPWLQVAVLVALFGALVGVRVLTDPPEQTVLFFYTTPILLEFAAGMVLGLAVPFLKGLPKVAGLSLLAAGIVSMVALDVLFSLPRTLGLGGSAVLIVAGAVVLEPAFRGRRVTPLRVLGDASYALYLVHLIVLVALQRPLAGWPWQLAASLMFVTCIVAALASYRFIERPILHWIRARSVRRREALA